MTRPQTPAIPGDVVSEIERAGHSLRRRFLSIIAGVIVVSAALLVLILLSLRAQAIRSGERLTESLAHIIAEQTNSSLETINQRLQFSASQIAPLMSKGLDEVSARALLTEEIRGLSHVRALSVADGQGRIVYSTAGEAASQTVIDREYFKIHTDAPSTGFHVGPPIRGRVSGAWLISATWPMRSAGGDLLGVLIAAVEPAYFDHVWREVEVGEGGTIALFRSDGVLMMRSPFDERSMGRSFADRQMFPNLATKRQGTFRDASPIDGAVRMLAYRALSGTPDLLVIVGRSESRVLAPWRQFATITVGIWFLAVIVIVVLAFFLDRSGSEKHKTVVRGQQMAQRLTLATEASSIGVWDWDLKADRWYATPTYFAMLGYEADQGVGLRKEWLEHVHPEDREVVAANIQAALAGADVPYRHDARVLHADGSYRWVSVIGRVLERDEQGKPSRLLGVMMDIIERKQASAALESSLREKEALLKEVHHRVKNNLQVITSLLRLEAGRSAEPATRAVLKDMRGRIHSMALLHEMLYRTANFARVELADYLRRLATQLVRGQNASPGVVSLSLHLSPVEVDIDQAIPAALIVNELLSNSLKHAFPEGRAGELRLDLDLDSAGRVRLCVSDSGVGLPPEFETRRTKSLGLQLVADLSRQLGGSLEVAPPAKFTVTFPLTRENRPPRAA